MASALQEELSEWYKVVPEAIHFDDTSFDLTAVDTFYLAPKIENNVAWIRSSYAACPAMFYWHAALNAATTTAPFLGREYRDGLEKHLLGYMGYVSSASQYLDGRFNPIVWSQAQKFTHLFEVEADCKSLFGVSECNSDSRIARCFKVCSTRSHSVYREGDEYSRDICTVQ